MLCPVDAIDGTGSTIPIPTKHNITRGAPSLLPSPPESPPQHTPPNLHAHCPPPAKKPFSQRVCTTNRRPFVRHSECPHTTEMSRAPTPLPRWLDSSNGSAATTGPLPSASDCGFKARLLHRVQHDRSILSLAVSESYVYAGSQSGEILIWSIETYQRVATLKGHGGSVLSLCLSPEHKLLFSSAGDAIIQVWHSETFENLHTIYSTFDVGDVFCVAFSAALQTAWFGAQNTSIQWYDLQKKDRRRPSLTSHPSKRVHRFFDSKGPGGRSTPRPSDPATPASSESEMLEIEPCNIVQYAHFGYVYCMLVVPAAQIGQGTEGEILLSGGGDGDVKLWSIDSSSGGISELQTLSGGDSGVLSMVVKDTLLYCGLTDGEVCIWDLDTLQLVRTVKAHCDDVLTLAVKGDCIFSGSASGYVRKWNQRFECISRWQAHSGLVLASAVTDRNNRLLYITGGNDDCVAIWDVSELPAAAATSVPANDQLLSSLAKLVSYRTVSSDPSCAEECRRGATYLKTLFKRFGATSTLLPTEDGRNPVVFARFSGAAGKKRPKGKTLLFYGHYDVIPAPLGHGWNTDPFELTGLNGYLYGRGVSDNKGPILAALFAAGELLQSGHLQSDIVFLIEGEEESGSRGFAATVQKHKQQIGPVDWILLANSYWLDDETPCLTYGLRGVIHATITVASENPDQHSGVDGSALNREPTVELVHLLSRLTDADGRILIPRFYDPVRPVTKEEEEMYTPIAAALQNNPASPLHGRSEEEIKQHLMAKWRYPSLTIHRVDVSGPPSNATIIPREASASISLRIVPDQCVASIRASLLSYLRSCYSGTNKLSVMVTHEAEPWLGDCGGEVFRVLERAVTDVWSVEKPLYIREGGSVPGARFLEMEFDAPAAHLPCGQRSDMAHLDNERLRLVNLYKVCFDPEGRFFGGRRLIM
jgi:di- and tripeptidase